MVLTLKREFDAPYGVPVRVAHGLRRMLAPNPGPFTFKGTGVYIIGEGTVAIVDPGPDDPAHIESLKQALSGETISHILITHTHRDHSPAAAALKIWSGAKTYGFGPHGAGHDDAQVEEGGDRDFIPDVVLKDDDVVRGADFTFRALHTPGHASNHLCFAWEEEKALFSGDHVMGWSTSVVVPPDGDMGEYLESLERLATRDDTLYYPTHGAPIENPKAHVGELIAHRLHREAQILQALRDGINDIPAIVTRAYPGLAPGLLRAAGKSVLAHLIYLERKGAVFRDNQSGLERFYIKA